MTQEQIDHIKETRKEDLSGGDPLPGRRLHPRAQHLSGKAFKPTATLYTVADLSVVWILADAFETDEQFPPAGHQGDDQPPSLDTDLEAVVATSCPSSTPPPAPSRSGSRSRTRVQAAARDVCRCCPARGARPRTHRAPVRGARLGQPADGLRRQGRRQLRSPQGHHRLALW